MAIAHSTTGELLEETAATHEIAKTGNSGEFMLMVGIRLGGTAESLTNAEDGWTKIDEAQGTTDTDNVVAAWWKTHTGSEPDTYTVSHSNSAIFKGVIVTYTGVDATPMDAAATQNADVADTASHTPASIEIATDQAWVISAIAKVGGSTNGTEPSGYTLRKESAGTGSYIGVADIGSLSIGAHQANDWTDLGNGGDHSSLTIALRPAATNTTIIVPTGPWF